MCKTCSDNHAYYIVLFAHINIINITYTHNHSLIRMIGSESNPSLMPSMRVGGKIEAEPVDSKLRLYKAGS